MKRLLFLFLLFVSFIGHANEVDDLDSSLGNALNELAQGTSSLSATTATLSLQGIDDSELAALVKMANSHKKPEGKIDGFLKDAQVGLVQQLINNNPFPQMPREQVWATLNGNLPNGVVKDYPILLEILTDFMRDKEAISSLIKIMFKQDRLKTYSFICAALFILSIILNLVMDKHSKIFKKILRRFFMTLGMTCLNLALFYLFFMDEIGPTMKIVWRHLLKTF